MRFRIGVLRLGVAVLLGILAAAHAKADTQLAFMTTGAETSQPIGHYEFCATFPAVCAVRSLSTEPVALDEVLWAQLVQVNAIVNSTIAPATDQEMFGRAEVWFYPTTRGDCEDYVLLKQRILLENGWPPSSLLITVVRKPDGEGHAVLTVRTDRGDFILDNLRGDISLWSATPYTYLKRQSEVNSGRWVNIQETRGDPVRVVGR